LFEQRSHGQGTVETVDRRIAEGLGALRKRGDGT
jgi:hypothetical protein